MSEKLNEWTVFSEKYKELCEWLTNMESKVSQNGDISIEEMIEKLRKVGNAARLALFFFFLRRLVHHRAVSVHWFCSLCIQTRAEVSVQRIILQFCHY